MRFSNRRPQRQILNLCSHLIDATMRLDVDVVDGSTVINKRRVRRAERDGVHPARGWSIWIVRLNRRAQVPSFTGQAVQRIAVMNLRILEFDVRGRISEQDSLVWFRRRNVNVAEVGTALRIESHPQLQAFDLQILQVDVSPKVQRVKILNPNGR